MCEMGFVTHTCHKLRVVEEFLRSVEGHQELSRAVESCQGLLRVVERSVEGC